MEIYHFQDFHIQNASLITKPIRDWTKDENSLISVVFIRNPYDYFDTMLFQYIKQRKSLLFTDEIISQMKVQDGSKFLEWLDNLNIFPFYNPQTFFMDIRKRIDKAIENLENFDYVVPYEENKLFLEHIGSDIKINKEPYPKLNFSLKHYHLHPLTNKFLDKDLQLYKRTLELWALTKESGFKTLKESITDKTTIYTPINQAPGFRGGCGIIEEKIIRGFAFYQDTEEPLSLEIYNNCKLLISTIANIPRPDLKEKFNLRKNTCGFQCIFEENTFRKGDKVDIIIIPENITIPIMGNAKDFLQGNLINS